ncbi:uncharacterized protein LOC132065714 isoform X1 [Lycium ferocissimum]|uniref:uncharacterized protein LOC132065714 isoform X1 n=1 Tax=Lycium ferocissimum TaxID=112874 RepID=UPI002815F41D|nr:uncharacterized protein LOC132065714 isoform X1 [Lycium ferocissimum]
MLMFGCDAKPFPKIQLLPGGHWSYALGKPYNYIVLLVDPMLQIALRQHNCQAFSQNISDPVASPSISVKILNFHNFFKCSITSNNTPNSTQKKNDHFAGYKMYNGCKVFNIYYKLLKDDSVEDIRAGNLTANCSLIRLPINPRSDGGGLFNMLSPVFLIEWKLSDDSYQCRYGGGGQSQTDKPNKFLCHKDFLAPPPVAAVRNLLPGTSKIGHLRTAWFMVATGTVFSSVGLLILLFCFRKKVLWHKYLIFWESKAEDHRNIEAFLKNNESCAPKRFSYSEVKRITSCLK